MIHAESPLPHATTAPDPHATHEFHLGTHGSEFFVTKATYYWIKTMAVLLVLHGLLGAFEALKFIIVEFPELNRQLEENAITVHEVNQLTIMAIVLALITVLSFLLAHRLHRLPKGTGVTLDSLASTGFLLITPFISRLLEAIDFVALLERLL